MKSQLSDKLQEQQLVTFNIRLKIKKKKKNYVNTQVKAGWNFPLHVIPGSIPKRAFIYIALLEPPLQSTLIFWDQTIFCSLSCKRPHFNK